MDCRFRVSFRRWLCVLGMIIATMTPGHAEPGILVWKDQPFHRDASASAVLYSRAEYTGPVMQFHIAGQRRSFTSGQFYRYIAFPKNAMMQFTDDAHYYALERSYQELLAFSNQYPNATPLLSERLQRMDAIMKGSDSGKVFYNSTWMARAEYDKILAQDQRILAAQKKQASKQEAGRKTAVLIGAGVFILLLVLTLVIRKWTWAGLLLIIPLAGAAWLTYHTGNRSWTKDIPKYIEIPPSVQPTIQKYLDRFNPPK